MKGRFPRVLLPNQGNAVEYSILCLHARWDYQEMERVMGKGESTYITMLRDPVDVFESQWEYYKHEKAYGMTIGNLHKLICVHWSWLFDNLVCIL